MSKKKRHGGRLVFDIETSPCQGWFWRPGYGINVPASNVRKYGKIICIAWSWEGSKKIETVQWDKNQDDGKLLAKFIPIMQEADEIIGHNHQGFDIRWVRTRALAHKLPCPPTFVTTDTWLQAKKYFRFPANSLKAIAKYLGLEGKIEPEHGLWEKVVFDKDAGAMKRMLTYCRRDVDQTAKVFERFVPYTDSIGHRGNNMQDCAHCGSSNTKWEKDRISTAGVKKTQFRCQEPGCMKYGTCAASKWYSNKKI
jgi:hypothetical protein